MIRRSQISITESNKEKLFTLDSILVEYKRVINLYIKELWSKKDFSSKFVDFKVASWLSARMLQCAGKQALSIVKSQRKKKKPHKPLFNRDSMEIDSRFIDVVEGGNSFDFWFKLTSIGNKINLKLPGRKHRHYFKYANWKLKKSCRIRKNGAKYFIDLFFEKEAPEVKEKGNSVAIDIGYKKLIATSKNDTFDRGLEQIYCKISRRKQGSKAFKRSLKERDNKINGSVKDLLTKNKKVNCIIAEDLKNVKKKSRGKIHKKFNNKLQRWSYSKVLSMLSLRCEEQGILFKKVNPAYTSQTCSNCGFKHKKNRSRETFKCLECGNKLDADYNAALNILALGSL
jgi:IS605 OrfB family transposase